MHQKAEFVISEVDCPRRLATAFDLQKRRAGVGVVMTASHDWKSAFTELFTRSAEKYGAGHQKAAGLVDEPGVKFLASIGYTEQEFFDFIEDFGRGGEPTLATALAIATVRRDYFLTEQKGVPTGRKISVDQLPPKDASLEGIAWLPRLIQKAVAKLKGEMPPELMYGCGGDRRFFREQKLDAAKFLQAVREAGGDEKKIVDWVKKGPSRA